MSIENLNKKSKASNNLTFSNEKKHPAGNKCSDNMVFDKRLGKCINPNVSKGLQ